MPLSLEVTGSTVRDFCMLERNFLAHLKLVLLLILLSSSALLGIRLPGPSQSDLGKASSPLAILTLIAALVTIAAALYEYHTGVKDLLRVRAFLVVTKVHYTLMAVVSMIIIATSGVYIAYSS